MDKSSERDKKAFMEFFESIGVEINIDGCGCCGSPRVAVQSDTFCMEQKAEFSIKMFNPHSSVKELKI